MTTSATPLVPLDLGSMRARLQRTSGRGFWRSLDELADSPDIQELLHREFKAELPLPPDAVGRRRFLTLMAASLGLAGSIGCTRQPAEQIVPYVKAPEEIVPGESNYYATSITRNGYALGLVARSYGGRPVKIEGNPEHPASLGATDLFAQASLLSMYDPDRSQTIIRRGVVETWDEFLTAMTREMETLRGRRGAGLHILTETITSPSLAAQIDALLADGEGGLPEARWHSYDPVSQDNVRAGLRLALGQPADLICQFDRARTILSLDCDFLFALPGSVRYARDFMGRRRVTADGEVRNRLFLVESTPTITGATADHRLPLRPSQIEPLARLIASRLGVEVADAPSSIEGIPDEWLAAAISDLQSSGAEALVLAGPGQPPQVHALVCAINDRLGSAGQTVRYAAPIISGPADQRGSLNELVEAMNAGQVQALVILGGNPVYHAPGELNFAAALNKVPLRVHLAEYYDETSFLCDWHVPAAHHLEVWSDARSYDGTVTFQQPLIAPLYGGKTARELVAVLQGQGGKTAYELVQEYWQKELGDNFGSIWRRAIHDGFFENSAAGDLEVTVSLPGDLARSQPGSGEFEVEFRPDTTIWDGRFANNGWLQECPKPLTKLTWDNVAAISPATAHGQQLTSGDVVSITIDDRTVEAPVWIMPGQPDGCVSLTFGYGRTKSGRIGTGVGYDAYQIRPASEAWFTTGTLEKTGRRHQLVTTQDHHSMEGRDIIRVTTPHLIGESEHKSHDDAPHAHAAGADANPHAMHDVEKHPSLYPEYDYGEGNQWGMVIDQTACIGCNACVVACQAENNVPVVGKEQVAFGREMHWLRIDRYYHSAAGDELQNPETYFQPMMCVHCEKAPCEVVCPVAATVHDSEGTNNMVYNRCVGTRYCSNNCPYKVRRFNFLQYTDEITPSLKLMRNPDVTARSRGVMEKCTYCIQRISAGRIEGKKQDRLVEDGEVLTACQQACPTSAITFGNLNAKNAKVAELKKSPLNYGVLAELGTQPRTTFLARVVNPHPDLPIPSAAKPLPTSEGHS